MEAKLIKAIPENTALFYRGSTSRKPYKVKFIRVMFSITAGTLRGQSKAPLIVYPDHSDDEIVEYDVEIEFSSLKREIVRSSTLYQTWAEAENILPVREKSLKGPRQISVRSGKILKIDGVDVNGIDICIDHFEGSITSEEANILWLELGKVLGYVDALKLPYRI